MSRGERKAMVAPDHPDLSLSRQCEPSMRGSVDRPVVALLRGEAREPRDADADVIDALFLKWSFYGSRQMARQLRREGICR